MSVLTVVGTFRVQVPATRIRVVLRFEPLEDRLLDLLGEESLQVVADPPEGPFRPHRDAVVDFLRTAAQLNAMSRVTIRWVGADHEGPLDPRGVVSAAYAALLEGVHQLGGPPARGELWSGSPPLWDQSSR